MLMCPFTVRAPVRADVLCMECILHWEVLVQIREAEIINERKRVQRGGGEERHRKGILKGRSASGRKGWSRRVPLESFLLLAALNHTLWVRKTHTLGLFSSALHLLPPQPLPIPLFESSTHALLPACQFSLLISTFQLICPVSPWYSLTPSFSPLHVLTLSLFSSELS